MSDRPPLQLVRPDPPLRDRAPAVEPLLDVHAVATILSVRPKRVYELGLPVVRLSARCLRWRRSDVEAWIANRRAA